MGIPLYNINTVPVEHDHWDEQGERAQLLVPVKTLP
jgi:hypothetical protein